LSLPPPNPNPQSSEAMDFEALADQMKLLSGELRKNALAVESVRTFFDRSPLLRRYNFYKVYTFSTVSATTLPQKLFDVATDAGNFTMHRIQILDPGAAGLVGLRIDSPTADLIKPITAYMIFDQFDFKSLYYEIVTGGVGNCSLMLMGWIK